MAASPKTATEVAAVPVVADVYLAIKKVRHDINALGIEKDSEASGGGIKFKFRGIDATLDSFSGPMEKAGLLMIPTYSDDVITERKTSGGGITFNVKVRGSYKLLSLNDGSEYQIGDFFGEANDTQDKAYAKAQSIALRQAYLQTFVVPLGADADPENNPDHQESDRQDGAQAKAEAPKARSSTPTQGAELGENQERILGVKLKSKGMERAYLDKNFGKVTTANFNEAVAWIKDHQE